MALATTVNFTITDSKGKSSVTKVRIPSTITSGAAVDFAFDFAELIAVASNGVVSDVSVSINATSLLLGVKTVAGILSDTFQKGLFLARSSIAGLFARFNIPTLNEDKVIDGSDILDPADVDIAAFITIAEDGVDDGLGNFIQPVDKRGNAIVAVDSGREIFRKS